jgi:hypothetical protein
MWGMVKRGTEAFALFLLIIIPSIFHAHPSSRPGITGIFKAVVSRVSFRLAPTTERGYMNDQYEY